MAISNPYSTTAGGSLLGGLGGTTSTTVAISPQDPYWAQLQGIYGPGGQVVFNPFPNHPSTVTKEPHYVIANIRVEKLENGYLVIYSKQGVTEKRRFAADMKEVGDAVIVACTDLALQGDTK